MASIKNLATQMNWEFDKRAMYGLYSGYQVSLVQNVDMMNAQNNYKILYIPYNRISPGRVALLLDYVKVNKKELGFVQYDISENLLTARILEGFKRLNQERFTNILNVLYRGLQEAEAHPKTTCAYCEEDDGETVTYINQIKLPAHQKCKEEALEQHLANKQQAANVPHSTMGYFGALMGAIIGVIPFVIGVWFGWYIGLLTFITGLVSYEGYKRFGGKTSPSTKYIISIVSLVIIVLSNVVVFMMIAISSNMTFGELLTLGDNQSIFTTTLGMSALFGVLGLGAVFTRIKRDEYNVRIR